MGHAGDPNVFTPNLDRLAAEGLTMRGAVGGTPLCCPFRGALLSGRYPHNSVPGHEHALPEGMPTIAAPFNQAGYHTAYFGKWHIDGFHEREGRAAFHYIRPERRGGFRQWLGYENNNSQFDCHVHGHGADGAEVPHYRLPGYETDAITDLGLGYLRERQADGQPFFCVLSVQPPHNPYVASAPWMHRHTPGQVQLRPNVPAIPRIREEAQRDLAGYYAMIENLDWNVGRLHEALHELGLLENTHLIFFSDHGDMHGSHGQRLKTNPYEESVRVPCILGGMNPVYGYRRGSVAAPMNHVDYGPTSLGLCGIPVPDWMEGTDYSGYRLQGRPAPDAPDSAFLQLPIPTGHADSTEFPWRGIVTTDGWKYACFEGTHWLMFNLNEDPYEQVNLAHNSRHAPRRRELVARLQQWIEQTGDSFALPTS